MGSKTEPSPTAFQGTDAGSGAHGAWLETRGISASTGRGPGPPGRGAGPELGPPQGEEGVLVRHRCPAEARAAVAHRARVDDRVVVVEPALGPGPGDAGLPPHGPPARPLEGAGQCEAVAAHHGAVALLVVHPEAGEQRGV